MAVAAQAVAARSARRTPAKQGPRPIRIGPDGVVHARTGGRGTQGAHVRKSLRDDVLAVLHSLARGGVLVWAYEDTKRQHVGKRRRDGGHGYVLPGERSIYRIEKELEAEGRLGERKYCPPGTPYPYGGKPSNNGYVKVRIFSRQVARQRRRAERKAAARKAAPPPRAGGVRPSCPPPDDGARRTVVMHHRADPEVLQLLTAARDKLR